MPTTWYRAPDEEFTSTADAIRTQTGDSAQIEWKLHKGFADAILAIPTGGGGGTSESVRDVNFYDYDGSIIASYSASDFANLSTLPSNPTHTGLTAQGWNWSLADAKDYVSKYGMLDIGQMYITDDGKTRIYIHLEDGRLSPMLGVCPNGSVTVDWGDASATTALTGTSDSTVKWTSNHTYAAPGDYVITLSVSGSMGIMGGAGADMGSCLLRYSSTGDNRNYGYRSAIRRVEIGNGVTSIGSSAFYYCYSLASVTIPSGVTSIGSTAFRYGYSLASVTIPSSVTSIGASVFQNCNSLASVTIPSSVTSIGAGVFQNCYSLASVTIPSSVTSIGSYAFYYCNSLASVTMPSGVTSIGDSAFYYCYSLASVTIPSSVMGIGNSAFDGCYSLASVTIPSSVTSIGSYAFRYGYSLGYIKFTAAKPPRVSGSNAWNDIPTDCIIYVPSGSLTAYTTATNYPDPATYQYVEY